MSNQWLAPESCPTLVVLVETVTAPLLIQHSAPICLEMEIDPLLEVPAEANQTAELIRTLVNQMLAEMPGGGELIASATASTGTIELEFADSGCDVDDRSCSIPMAAAAIGAEIEWNNGPNGGAVVRIKFGRRGHAARRAA